VTKTQRPSFRVMQQTLPDKSTGWFWLLDIARDDGLIGPFESRDEAVKDARETLGIVENGEG
jgi:hypothetical protein